MHKIRCFAIVLFFAFVFSATRAGEPAVETAKSTKSVGWESRRNEFVGHWYGDLPTRQGGRRQWIMQRNADGTFEVFFHLTAADGKVTEQKEVGDWGITGNQLVTVTRSAVQGGKFLPARTAASYFWDAYEVNSLKGGEFNYTNHASGDTYTTRKVADDFKIPE